MRFGRSLPLGLRQIGLLLALGMTVLLARAGPMEHGSAQALRELHQKLEGRLAGNQVVLDSAETPDGLRGDVHAVIDHSLQEVRSALGDAAQWCEMLVLHINNRRCRVAPRADGGSLLTLSVVRRYDKPVEQAFVLSFVHRTVDSSPDYLAVVLSADAGPLGTSHYRIVIEATPLDERKTFVHFGYAYDHGMLARLATMAYLATFGSHKVGFTVTGTTPEGRPDYIRGLRGLVERNAMRYFLTLEAYLAGAHAPPRERFDRRLNNWFDAIERYPAQLHEIDRATYLGLKHADRKREAAAAR